MLKPCTHTWRSRKAHGWSVSLSGKPQHACSLEAPEYSNGGRHHGKCRCKCRAKSRRKE